MAYKIVKSQTPIFDTGAYTDYTWETYIDTLPSTTIICDTAADVANLPTDVGAGSIATICAAGGVITYMLNASATWVLITETNEVDEVEETAGE